MDAEEARRLKELEVENARLKKLLAEAHLDLEVLKIGFGGKALAPQDKRKAIARMLEHARISERRACRLAGLSRDAWRHPSQPGACTVRLRERIHAVAMQRRRFGRSRVHDMLRSEFPGTNHKKVYRLYREQGLAVRKRNKARKYRPLVAAMRANQTWSLDFVSDALANGRRIKCLTITDDFTRECIDIAADLSMPGAYVARVLERTVCFRGYSQAIRTDNGPEFTCGPSWPGCRREVSSTS